MTQVYCIPINKLKGWNTTAKEVYCDRFDINRRHEVMLANQKLSDVCGLQVLGPGSLSGRCNVTGQTLSGGMRSC